MTRLPGDPAQQSVDVAIVGLGFGADFIPIYADHPGVRRVALCDPDEDKLNDHCRRYDIVDRFTSLQALLDSDDYDAVHLVTPVTLHASQAVAVLASGRHCACAVPMGLDLDELDTVIAAAQDARKNYMMMETAVYQRAFLLAAELYRRGDLGALTFLRGAHVRDRSEMPPYWQGFPPMKYATHVISPLLALADRRVEAVHAYGSGTLTRPEMVANHGNPFPLETALLKIADSDLKAEVTQACFQTARTEQEGFSVYAEKMSLEWPQLGEDDLHVFTMHAAAEPDRPRFRRVDHSVVRPPDDVSRLPTALVRYLRPTNYQPDDSLAAIPVPSHHGGSHPHLVHEFISSILERRQPRIDEITAAEWCAPGICAHESAMRDGERIEVPDYRGRTSSSPDPPLPTGQRPPPTFRPRVEEMS